MIQLGLSNPTSEVCKAISEPTMMGKGNLWIIIIYVFPLVFMETLIHFSNQVKLNHTLVQSTFFLFLGADDQPANSLYRVAAFKVEDLLQKSSEMGRGVPDKMHQTLLKEWGPKSLSTLPEDTIQEVLIEVSRFICFLIIL